jgi:hypothetical protein
METHLLFITLGTFALALLVVAVLLLLRRRRSTLPQEEGWMTDDMVEQIIDLGVLSERQVPDEVLDLPEVSREEERFWSETWDEPERYWD